MIVREGSWCDVAVLPDGRFAHVVTNGNSVTTYIDGIASPPIVAPEALLFCRAACWNNTIVSVHQGNGSGSAYLLRNRTHENLGPTFGVQPVAIDGTYVYIVRNNQSYDRISLDAGEVEHLPHGAPGSSQGISDVVNGLPQWADLHRVVSVAYGNDSHVALTFPNLRGRVIVGQADPSQIAGVFGAGDEDFTKDIAFTAIQGDAFEPHVAQSGERYAICARTQQHAAYVEVPPYPALIINAPTPAPPPVPKPDPKPEPIPVPVIPVQNRAAALAEFHQTWNGGHPITDDAEKHRFTEALAAFLNLDGTGRWGRKARAGTDAKSKDTLGYWLGSIVPKASADGKVDAFDVVASTGAVGWDLRAESNDPGYRNIDARWFAVSPVTNPPVVQPPAPPAPSVDLSAVFAEIAALRGRVESLERVADSSQGRITNAETTLYALANRKYRVSGKTRTSFGHQHMVDLSVEPQL